MMSHLEILLRIGVGTALGGVIGYERNRHRRPAGLRTHLIVALAASTFMVISSQFVYWQHYGKDDLVEADPERIAASVVSAVGFLAGGAILRTGVTVQGLTTAAGLWLVTAIGMCAGAGMLVESAAVTLVGVSALALLRRFEDKDDHVSRRRVSVVLGQDARDITSVISSLVGLGAKVSEVKYDKWLADERKRVVATLDVEIADSVGLPRLVEAIEAVRGVRRIVVRSHV